MFVKSSIPLCSSSSYEHDWVDNLCSCWSGHSMVIYSMTKSLHGNIYSEGKMKGNGFSQDFR